MSLAGCQISPVNFHLQKSLEISCTNSADKIQSQNYKSPYLMPIRVKVVLEECFIFATACKSSMTCQVLGSFNLNMYMSELDLKCTI